MWKKIYNKIKGVIKKIIDFLKRLFAKKKPKSNSFAPNEQHPNRNSNNNDSGQGNSKNLSQSMKPQNQVQSEPENGEKQESGVNQAADNASQPQQETSQSYDQINQTNRDLETNQPFKPITAGQELENKVLTQIKKILDYFKNKLLKQKPTASNQQSQDKKPSQNNPDINQSNKSNSNIKKSNQNNPAQALNCTYEPNKNRFTDILKEVKISNLKQEDRERNDGFSFDMDEEVEVSDALIKLLIYKFINQRFKSNTSDLNSRSKYSLEKTTGFTKWEIKQIVRDITTTQLTKVPYDKYSYSYDKGKNETIPLSFYFDMSGSMTGYSHFLAIIAIELLKKNIKVLVGFNEQIKYQFNEIDKNMNPEILEQILITASRYDSTIESMKSIAIDRVDSNIDEFLVDHKAEKVVIFADFDPLHEIINLSQKCKIYYFCFEQNYNQSRLDQFKGFIYPVQSEKELVEGLKKISTKTFRNLVYFDSIQRTRGGR